MYLASTVRHLFNLDKFESKFWSKFPRKQQSQQLDQSSIKNGLQEIKEDFLSNFFNTTIGFFSTKIFKHKTCKIKREKLWVRQIFFSIKISNLHYTNKQRAYNIEIKNIKRNYYTCTEPYEPLQKS